VGATAFFDGNWIDICSLVGGVVYARVRWSRIGGRRFLSRETGLDIANGVSLFPLFLLAGTSISSTLLNALLQSNKLILSVAGVVALLAILDDRGIEPA
jgi:hypothetical protein